MISYHDKCPYRIVQKDNGSSDQHHKSNKSVELEGVDVSRIPLLVGARPSFADHMNQKTRTIVAEKIKRK